MKSLVVKRSIVIDGHKTSVTVEEAFWKALHEIAHERGMGLNRLIASIDRNRQFANLSSAIRLFVLEVYRDQSTLAAAGNLYSVSHASEKRLSEPPPEAAAAISARRP